MRIKEISLKNFRSYRDQVIIRDLSDVNIFIGPNSAGKSNVLDALKYVRGLRGGNQTKPFLDMAFDRDQDCEIEISMTFTLDRDQRNNIIDSLFKNSSVKSTSVKESNFLSNIVHTIIISNKGVVGESIRTSNIVDAELPLIEKRVQSKGSNTVDILSVLLDEKCRVLEKLENIEGGLVKRGDMGVEFRLLNFSHIISPSEQQVVTYLSNFIDSWEWFDPIRQVTPRMQLGEDMSLLSTGENLTRFLNSLQSSDPRRFVKLVDDVIGILPMVSNILAPPRGGEATLNVQEKGLTSKIEVSNISFGTMQILILVVGIVTKKSESVILIEEPELHLHATSQRRLFKLIQREARENRKQFLLTTHSTIFTACDNQNNTYLVIKNEGTTSVRRIEELKELGIVKNVLGHRNTDLYGDECAVFIEGDSEEVAFPIISNAMGYNLVEKGIRLINVEGAGKAVKIGQYLKYLKDSNVLTYVIADGNKIVKEKIQDWIGENILRRECAKTWTLEFEDCFDLEMITKAMNEILRDKGVNFEITTNELYNSKTEGKSIVKVLSKMLHEKDLPELDKPSLSEKLAMFLAEDIKNNPNHKELLPELVIEEIVKTVDSRISR